MVSTKIEKLKEEIFDFISEKSLGLSKIEYYNLLDAIKSQCGTMSESLENQIADEEEYDTDDFENTDDIDDIDNIDD